MLVKHQGGEINYAMDGTLSLETFIMPSSSVNQ